MTPFETVVIVLAGCAAGAINTIVGSGSLITFPTLLAFGYSPIVANVSNTLGLVPGSLSGAVGYRRELAGQRDRAIRLGIAATLGGLTGGLLLLALPATSFATIVPFLILFACALMAVQPRLSAAMASRRGEAATHPAGPDRGRLPDGHLRWLLRGRPGRHPHLAAGHLPDRTGCNDSTASRTCWRP